MHHRRAGNAPDAVRHRQVIEVFVIGVGGVGGALLGCLSVSRSTAVNIDTRVRRGELKALLANIAGLNLDNWRAELAQANAPFNLGRLIHFVERYHLLNPVIVDCTSSQGGGRPV